jgi:hypothetical protein
LKRLVFITFPLSILLFIFTCISACIPTPREQVEPAIAEPVADVLYILNEGLFNQNNASLSRFHLNSRLVEQDVFFKVNGRKLGDTGNAIYKYGSKIYIVVNVSNTIEVIDAISAKSIAQISMLDGIKGRQPREIAFINEKAFVTNFDGTVAVFDTTDFIIKKYIHVGRNPESIVADKNKLYVSNSGGLDFPNYDSTISVIDYQKEEEEKKIAVGTNPGTIKATKNGDIYVVTRGNYANIPSQLLLIQKDTIKQKFDIEVSQFEIAGDSAYLLVNQGGNVSLQILDLQQKKIVNQNVFSIAHLQTPYGLYIDKQKNIYLSDAQSYVNIGTIYGYNQQGLLLYQFKAGLNPSNFVRVAINE